MAFIFETLVLDVGVFAACAFAVVYTYFLVSYTYWKKRNVPYIKPNFPFGNIAGTFFGRQNFGHAYEDFYKKLDGEKYGGFYAFKNPKFIFRDPDIIKNILVKDFSSFYDRGMSLDEGIEPLIGHLFFLQGHKWRNLRFKLSPTFTSGKMKIMFETLVECGHELVSTLEKSARNEGMLEIKDILARYSTDVISSCAFGIHCNCLKNPKAEFRQWGRKIFDPSIRTTSTNFLLQTIPSLLNTFRLSLIDPKVSKYFRIMVEETVNYRENNNFKRNDFMQLLIQIKNKVNVDDENDRLELNGHEILDNKPTENGMYSHGVLYLNMFCFKLKLKSIIIHLL
jgi:cytochrome P450 family 6